MLTFEEKIAKFNYVLCQHWNGGAFETGKVYKIINNRVNGHRLGSTIKRVFRNGRVRDKLIFITNKKAEELMNV